MTDTRSAIRVRDQLGKPDDVDGIFVQLFDNVDVQIQPLEVYKRDVTNDSIWGDGVAWGDDNWQGTYSEPNLLQTVSNAFDTYIEKFTTERFKEVSDTSNVTWGTSGSLVFGGTEGTASSRRIYWEPSNVVSIQTSLTGDDIENLTMYVQSNESGNWVEVAINGATDIVASTSLRWRLVGENATVKDLRIKYLRG